MKDEPHSNVRILRKKNEKYTPKNRSKIEQRTAVALCENRRPYTTRSVLYFTAQPHNISNAKSKTTNQFHSDVHYP